MEKTVLIRRNGITHRVPANPLSNQRYFGGGGSETKQVDKYTPGQMELLEMLTGQLGPQIGQGITPYQGQRVAGPGALQQQGFGIAGGMGGMAQGSQQHFQDILGQVDPGLTGRMQGTAEQTLGGLMQPYDTGAAKDYWQQSFVDPAMQQWRQDIMPGIKESYASRNAADSGAMNRALARSGEDLGTNLSAQLGNILYSGQQSHLGRQQAGVGQAMQLSGMPSANLAGAGQVGQFGANTLSQMLGMGAQQRDIGQQGLGAAQQQWGEAQPYNNPWLQQFLPPALGAQAFDTVVEQQAPSIASQLAPYALAGGIAYASDRRLKEDIETITGALDKLEELDGKMFKFIDGPRSGGVIAQDLEKVMPSVVGERNGYKTVDYNAVIGLLVNAVKELHQLIKDN